MRRLAVTLARRLNATRLQLLECRSAEDRPSHESSLPA